MLLFADFFFLFLSQISTRLIYTMKLIHCDCPICFELTSISSLLLARLARFEIQNWNGWCVSCTRSDIYEMTIQYGANEQELTVYLLYELKQQIFLGPLLFSLTPVELNASWCCYKCRCRRRCCRYRFSLSTTLICESAPRASSFSTHNEKKIKFLPRIWSHAYGFGESQERRE